MPAEARLPARERARRGPRGCGTDGPPGQSATGPGPAAAGELAAGDLVLIAGLAAEHHAARQTAARALALLEREGLVKRYPGHGYTVQPAIATVAWGARARPALTPTS